MKASRPSTASVPAARVDALARAASWAPWVLALSVPALFLHIRYQPKVEIGLGSTSVEPSLADVAILAVLVAGVLRGRHDGLAPVRHARVQLAAAGVLVAIAVLSLATPRLLGQEYALAEHAVSAAKFAWYALLFPAVVLVLRTAADAAPLFRVLVAWSAVATTWGGLQFLGLVDEFEGRRPGQREPSFVGIHDLAALSGAALLLGLVALVLTRQRPIAGGWVAVAVVAGGLGVVLSGAMTGVAGAWLALVAAVLVARARGSLSRGGAVAAVAIVLAVSAGTTLMRADAIARFGEWVGILDRTEDTGAASYPQRALLAYIGAKVWLDHPVTGVGWLASSEEWAYGPHLDDARRRFPHEPETAFPSPEHPWGVQTLYVQALADLGIVGFLSLLALFGTALAAALRGARTSSVPLVGLAWLLVCAGIWGGLGIVAGIPLLALTWIALGLACARV